ncbi:MAG: restriction endonuclease subunit S [Dokdonella sp.]
MRIATANQMLLGEIVRFGNGKAIKPGGEGAYPVFGSNGVIGGGNEFRHENGVVIGRVGAYCGAVVYCRGKFWASDNTLVAYPATEQIDTQFLYYLLADANLSRYAGGAAQPLVTQTVLKQVEVRVPSLAVQKRIVGILSAYDELIENSQRRIKILESMARALYREWFVHFRFPGHENHPRVASPLGEIPQGWEIKKLGNVADISWGDTSTTKASYVDVGYPAYSASGSDGKLEHYDFDRTGIVLSAIGAQCGKTWLARGKWSCIKNTIRFWSKDESTSTEFLFIATEGQEFWPRRGAAQPFISQGDAERIDLLTPDSANMKCFSKFTAATLEQIAMLSLQIQNLRRTRDLLLPRLLSGQIPVEVGSDTDGHAVHDRAA